MEAKYAACTIVARNYLAQAQLLAASFAAAHPDIPFHTLVVDGIEDDIAAAGVGTVLLPESLGIDLGTLHSMMLIYGVMELSTALKPALLSTLLRSGYSAAAYFDPDIKFYENIDDIFELALQHGTVLTPHTVSPYPRDGKFLSERNIMQAGIFNLGFIAVGPQSLPFLRWWHERLTVDAVVDIHNGLFTDQRWIDWVPALFPHYIVKDQGLNAAYWNVHERPIRRVGDAYFAGADRLRFFHFSGYDPLAPWQLSRHMGERPRVTLADLPALRGLCDDYGQQLIAAGHTTARGVPYGLDRLDNGLELLPRLRRMARAVTIGEVESTAPVPDAIAEPEKFAEWVIADVIGSGPSAVSPAQWSVWNEREDLRRIFPLVPGVDSAAFLRWCGRDLDTKKWLSSLARIAGAVPRQVAKPPRRRAFGWSVIAYARSELGVGEAGRRAAATIAATGMPTELVGTQVGTLSRAAHEPRAAVHHTINYENVLACVNADQLPHMVEMLDLNRLRGWHAGLWFWELEEFPDSFAPAFDLLHEVWVSSEFTRRAVQAKTDREVRKIRLPIEVPTRPTGFTRRSFGLRECDFLFLTNFDYLSVPERKNPEGTIRAYVEAFEPGDGAVLVVKSINGAFRPAEREAITRLAADRADIVFMEDYLSAAQMKGLIELADCFVSMHRSEGYGLNLADAMAHGTPTIATGYSGNLEFMSDETSILIPYELTEVGPRGAPYDPRSVWADPDVAAAAAAMRTMADDRTSGTEMARRALAHVREHHSLGRAADSVRESVLGSTGWGL